jgi:hypothetical protein
MSEWNVVQFVNGNPANLSFLIYGTPATATYIDVDLDVSITHPFPGLNQYDGYDVRGIFVGDGHQIMKHNAPKEIVAQWDVDQFMEDFDELGHGTLCGNSDGYTRWWNPVEFPVSGPVGYTVGKYATPDYVGSATFNPYKYFADDLGPCDDALEFVKTTANNGVFKAGSTNTRNYYLRFPMPTPGVVFQYAILASWIDETTHPANAHEVVACSAEVTPDLWFLDAANWGGHLKVDFTLFSWFNQPDRICIESKDLFGDVKCFDPSLIATGGGVHYSTYYVDIPAEFIEKGVCNEFWIIAEYANLNYSNEYDIPNEAWDEMIVCKQRYHLPPFPEEPYNLPPVCVIDPIGAHNPVQGYVEVCIEFDATGSYDPDGSIVSWEWDFDDDGTFGDPYDSGTDDDPTKCWTADYQGRVCLRVTDDMGASSECCVDVDIEVLPLYKETFDDNTQGWSGMSFRYLSWCSTPPAPGYSTNSPFGPSGSGNFRGPTAGTWSTSYGGSVTTGVSEPFVVPSGVSDCWLRAYMTMDNRTSWPYSPYYYAVANWKGVVSSASGTSPFNGNGALPSGGQVLNRTTAHGSTWPAYNAGTSHTSSAGFNGQNGWYGSFGGGCWPSSLGQYVDLTIPNAWYGSEIKVAYQMCTDYCGDTYSFGWAIDDVELMIP